MDSANQHPAVKLAESRLKAHAHQILPNSQVWLFGSRATKKALRHSDFDLAVQLDEKTPESALFDFEETVKADPEIIYAVDIVNLNSAPVAVRQEIHRNGILWTN